MNKTRLAVRVVMGLMLVAFAARPALAENPPLLDRIVEAIKSLVLKVAALEQTTQAQKTLLVRDAKGTLVGVLLGGRGDVTEQGFQVNYDILEAYDLNHHVIARFNAFTGQAYSDHNFAVKFLLFPSSDCTGQAYVSNANGTEFGVLNNPYTLVVRLVSEGPEEFYAGNKTIGAVANVEINSHRIPDNSCQQETETFPLVTAVDLINLDYTGPLSISTR